MASPGGVPADSSSPANRVSSSAPPGTSEEIAVGSSPEKSSESSPEKMVLSVDKVKADEVVKSAPGMAGSDLPPLLQKVDTSFRDFDDLGDKVATGVSLIIEKLGVEDILRCMNVSKFWRRTVINDRVVGKRCYESFPCLRRTKIMTHARLSCDEQEQKICSAIFAAARAKECRNIAMIFQGLASSTLSDRHKMCNTLSNNPHRHWSCVGSHQEVNEYLVYRLTSAFYEMKDKLLFIQKIQINIYDDFRPEKVTIYLGWKERTTGEINWYTCHIQEFPIDGTIHFRPPLISFGGYLKIEFVRKLKYTDNFYIKVSKVMASGIWIDEIELSEGEEAGTFLMTYN